MASESQFTHFTEDGRPVMVDVSEKPSTKRTAVAECFVHMKAETRDAILQQAIAKGDVLSIAQLAGIMAAKRTFELIPLCHQIPIHHVSLDLSFVDEAIDAISSSQDAKDAVLRVEARVDTAYQTGVEMEALTACSIASLTVYDMCKAIDRAISIERMRLVHKSGGRSGVFNATSSS